MNEMFYKNIRDYLEIAIRRKWWLIIPTVVLFPISVYISFNRPNIYEARTMILVEPQKVPAEYVKPLVTGDPRAWLSTIREQVLSSSLLDKVSEELGLYQENPDDVPRQTLTQKFMAKLGLQTGGPKRKTQAKVIAAMRKNITITTVGRRKNIDAFSISFKHGDPQTAMLVTNRIANDFIEANLSIREQIVEETSEFLNQELERLRKDLEARELKISRFRLKYKGELPSQLTANLNALDRSQLELEATRRAIKAQEDKKEMRERELASGLHLPDQPGALEAKLSDLKVKLNSLRIQYHDSFPDVILLNQEIEDVEAQLAQRPSISGEESSQGPTNIFLLKIEKDLQGLGNRESKLMQKIDLYEERVEKAPLREQELMRLQRDLNNTRGSYQSLLNKKLSARISESLEKRGKGRQFRIIDPPKLPTQPIGPDRAKLVLLGLIGGIGLGIGLVIIRETMDTSFHHQEDLEKTTGLAVLATIPNFDQALGKKGYRSKAYGKNMGYAGKRNG